MINIGIEVSPSIDQKTGIGTYSYLLSKNLLNISNNNIFYKFIYNFIFNKDRKKDFFNTSRNKNYIVRIPKRYYYNLYKYKIPLNIFTGKLDILHVTGLMSIHTTKKTKRISTIHDIAFLRIKDLYSPYFLNYLNSILLNIISNSDLLIASSHSTANDLIQFYNVPEKKVKVVYFNASDLYKKKIESNELAEFIEEKKIHNNYFLFVGTLEKRKNLINIIKGFAKFKKRDKNDFYLYIIGKGNPEILKTICQELDIEDYVIFKGYVPLNELPLYYKTAKFLLYISYYEGFGIPILEAFCLSLPVITTYNSSMKELASDAGIYVKNPEDINEIADVLFNATTYSKSKLTSLIELMPTIMNKFDFTLNAKKIIEIYKDVI